MNTIFRFITLALCFELALGPNGHSLLSVSESFADDCPAGQSMNSKTNKCETNQQVINANRATKRCAELTGDAQKKCFAQNAGDALGQAEKDGEVRANDSDLANQARPLGGRTDIARAATAATIAVPLFFLTHTMFRNWKYKKAGKSKIKCNPNSLLLMYAGAGVLATGEAITYFSHKKKLKKMSEEWNNIVTPEEGVNKDRKRAQATNAQSQAFEMLAQNEESIAKVANTKFIYYGAAAGLFAAGVGIGIAEQVQLVRARAVIAAAAINPTGAPAILEAKQKIEKLTCSTESTEGATKKYFDAFEADCKAKGGSIGNDYLNNKKVCNPGTTYINPKYQKVARANILKSANLYQALEQIKELENIDFEPYSRLSYEEEYNQETLKATAVNQSILSTILSNLDPIPEAHAGCGSYPDCAADEVCENNYLCVPKTTPLSKAKTGSPTGLCGGHSVCGPNDVCIDSVCHPKLNTSTSSDASDTNTPEPSSKYQKVTEKFDSSGKLVERITETDDSPSPTEDILEEVKETIQTNGSPAKTETVNIIDNEMSKKFSKAINSPVTRIALNSLMGLWIGVMSGQMKKQANISKERAAELRKIKLSFETHDGLMNCKEEDRTNPQKPECYCYTPDNTPNPARGNSKICQGLIGNLNIKKTDYSMAYMDRTCLDSNSNIDTACACKKTKSCTRIGGKFEMRGFNPGTFSMISGAVAPANDLANGNLAPGEMNGASLFKNAARIKAETDKMIAKDPSLSKQTSAIEKSLGNSLLASTKGMSMGLPSSGSGSTPMTPQQAAAALERDLEDANKTENMSVVGGGGGGSATPIAEDKMPDFGISESGLAVQESQVAEVMKQDLDYGNNDINQGSTTNLFEVLSDRYKRSGMRRLFDESGTAPADKPSKKEIHD